MEPVEPDPLFAIRDARSTELVANRAGLVSRVRDTRKATYLICGVMQPRLAVQPSVRLVSTYLSFKVGLACTGVKGTDRRAFHESPDNKHYFALAEEH